MGAKHFLAASATRIYPRSGASNSSVSNFLASEYQLNQTPRPATRSNTSRLRLLTIGRLVLTILTVVAAIAVIGCEGHALNVYDKTNLDEAWGVSTVWPVGLDLRITQAILVAACVVALTAIICVVAGVVPVPRRFNLLVVLLSTGISIIGLAAAIFGVAYTASITRDSGYDRDNLQSWTCRWVNGASDVNKMFPNGLANIQAPQDFKRICEETKAGFGVLAAIIGLQTVMVVVTALCAWVEVKMRKAERDAIFSEKAMSDSRF